MEERESDWELCLQYARDKGKRERERVCVYVLSKREREGEVAYPWCSIEKERERECVCVCWRSICKRNTQRKRERELCSSVVTYNSKRERERESRYATENGRERESWRKTVGCNSRKEKERERVCLRWKSSLFWTRVSKTRSISSSGLEKRILLVLLLVVLVPPGSKKFDFSLKRKFKRLRRWRNRRLHRSDDANSLKKISGPANLFWLATICLTINPNPSKRNGDSMFLVH